ncbi:MAG TPA: hypothetical protein VI895_07940 [Bdellovibrionota bacterium]|nr:hypothetical protein [Bdellovibrionota bacterium]
MQLVQPTNRRRLERRSLEVSQTLRLKTFSNSIPVNVVDASPLGVQIEIPGPYFQLKKHDLEDLALEIGPSCKQQVSVCHTKSQGDAQFVGLRYDVQLPQTPERLSFASTDSDWDLLKDGDDIADILNDLARTGPQTLIHWRQMSRTSKAYAVIRDDAGQLTIERCDERRRVDFKEGPIQLRFELYQCCYIATSSVVKVEGNRAQIRPPASLVRLLRRETSRASVPSDRKIIIRFLDVFGTNYVAGLPILDIAEHGVLVMDSKASFLAPIGSELRQFRIVDGDHEVHAKAQVASVRRTMEGQHIGIRVDVEENDQRRAWHDLVLAIRYPSIDVKYEKNDHESVWKLFKRSGYIGHTDDPESETNFAEMYDVTKQTWKNLASSGTRWSRRLMCRNLDEIAGHLQMDRYYDETWCVHHLAIDKTVSKTIAKDLYGVVTDVLSSESARFLISYHRPDLAWNQRNYYNFVERYPFSGHHNMQLFHLHYVNVDEFKSPAVASDFTVGPANKYDERRIRRWFEMSCPALEREALGLHGDDIHMAELDKALTGFNLTRRRLFLVAKRGTELLAFARIEIGSHGINVVRLFDAMFLHFVNVSESQKNAVVLKLIDEALKLFRSAGRNRFLLPIPEQMNLVPFPSGIKYACDEVRWIANCEATRRYQAYSSSLFGRLISRRKKHQAKS